MIIIKFLKLVIIFFSWLFVEQKRFSPHYVKALRCFLAAVIDNRDRCSSSPQRISP